MKPLYQTQQQIYLDYINMLEEISNDFCLLYIVDKHKILNYLLKNQINKNEFYRQVQNLKQVIFKIEHNFISNILFNQYHFFFEKNNLEIIKIKDIYCWTDRENDFKEYLFVNIYININLLYSVFGKQKGNQVYKELYNQIKNESFKVTELFYIK